MILYKLDKSSICYSGHQSHKLREDCCSNIPEVAHTDCLVTVAAVTVTVAYLSSSVKECSSLPVAHLLMPDTQWPGYWQRCQHCDQLLLLCAPLLSSLLLDAVEECAGHSFPLPHVWAAASLNLS